MGNIALTTETPASEDAKHFKAAIDEIFVQIAASDVRIAHDQAKINQLKTETRNILAELKSLL